MLEVLESLGFSLFRLFTAYALSLAVAVVVGVLMARSRVAEAVLYPVIDVLQSIPVVGFFPVVLLVVIRSLPGPIGLELASIILIFTGQVWNMILGVYSSVKSISSDLEDMARAYGLNAVARVFKIYIPSALTELLRNTIVSWAGGLFFLTACEVISFGSTQYRLRGIGTFIVDASMRGDTLSIALGVLALTVTSLAVYIALWNPLVNLSIMRSGGEPETYPAVNFLVNRLSRVGVVFEPFVDWLIYISSRVNARVLKVVALLILAGSAATLTRTLSGMLHIPTVQSVNPLTLPWLNALTGLMWSLTRVSVVLLTSFISVALLSFYAYRRGRAVRHIIAISGEVLASIPAFLWWSIFSQAISIGWVSPLIVSLIIMYQGTIWYTFFNAPLSFSSEVEKRVYEMSVIYRIDPWRQFAKVFLPMNMPKLMAGLSSGWGGAWNSIIAAEYAVLGSTVVKFYGIGCELNEAVVAGNYAVAVFYTIFLSTFIVLMNRTLWRWLYNRVFMKFRVID